MRLNVEEHGAELDRGGVLDAHLADGAHLFGGDLVHELHRLDDAQRLIGGNLIAHLDERRLIGSRGRIEGADHRRLYGIPVGGVVVGRLGRGGCRGRSHSSGGRGGGDGGRRRGGHGLTGHAHRDAGAFLFDYDFADAAFLGNANQFANLIDIHVIFLLGAARFLLEQEVDLLGCAVLAQVRARLVGEQRVHKDIFLALREIADFFCHLVKRRGDERAGRDVGIEDVGVAHDLFHDFLVHAAGRLAVVAADVVLHLLGHDAPALARDHVEHGLRAHNLGHRRDERRIADLGANLWDFRHNLAQTIRGILNFQLAHEVRHHAARNLVGIHLHVRERGDAALVVAALAHAFPVFRDLEEQAQVKAGVVAAFLERCGEHLDSRLGVAEGKRRGCGVNDGSAGFSGLDVVCRGHAADVMAVQVQRQADFRVERLHDALGAIRREHARHILDADGVRAQILELLAVFKEAIERVNRAYGVGNRTFEMRPALLDCVGVVHHVADVVQRVEHAEHMDAVTVCRLDEAVADFARVMLVANQILPARKHRKRGVRGICLDGTQALPRVLVEKAEARVERCAAPSLDSPIPHAVHLRQDRQHVADLHTRGPQALLAVADGGIHNLKPWHELTPPSVV